MPHDVWNVFWQEWDSNPRTHSSTTSLDWGNSGVWLLWPLSHHAWFSATISFWVSPFNWVTFSIQNSNLVHSMRPFQKIWLKSCAFKDTRILVWGELSTEKSISPRLKHFLTWVRFEPLHTFVYQISRLRKFLGSARYTAWTSWLGFVVNFARNLLNFNLTNSWIHRSNL